MFCSTYQMALTYHISIITQIKYEVDFATERAFQFYLYIADPLNIFQLTWYQKHLLLVQELEFSVKTLTSKKKFQVRCDIFEASSGRSEAKVATKSNIVPISMVSQFFFARFRDIFRKFFSSNASSSEPRKGIGSNFFVDLGARQERKFCRKKWQKIFGHHGIFCINILKSCNLHTAFLNFDQLLLVNHCSNGVVP